MLLGLQKFDKVYYEIDEKCKDNMSARGMDQD